MAEHSYELHSARETFRDHDITVKVSRRSGSKEWIVDIEVAQPDGATVRRLHAGSFAASADAVEWGIQHGRDLVVDILR